MFTPQFTLIKTSWILKPRQTLVLKRTIIPGYTLLSIYSICRLLLPPPCCPPINQTARACAWQVRELLQRVQLLLATDVPDIWYLMCDFSCLLSAWHRDTSWQLHLQLLLLLQSKPQPKLANCYSPGQDDTLTCQRDNNENQETNLHT